VPVALQPAHALRAVRQGRLKPAGSSDGGCTCRDASAAQLARCLPGARPSHVPHLPLPCWQTKVIPNSETPEWNDEFDFVVDSPVS
jgi:hypothetical protein